MWRQKPQIGVKKRDLIMNIKNNESTDNPKNGIALSSEQAGQMLSHLESWNQAQEEQILDMKKRLDRLEAENYRSKFCADLRHDISQIKLSHNVCDSCAISYILKGSQCRAGGE
jgi:hypothetical protein